MHFTSGFGHFRACHIFLFSGSGIFGPQTLFSKIGLFLGMERVRKSRARVELEQEGSSTSKCELHSLAKISRKFAENSQNLPKLCQVKSRLVARQNSSFKGRARAYASFPKTQLESSSYESSLNSFHPYWKGKQFHIVIHLHQTFHLGLS